MNLNGAEYFYLRNGQGDIIGVIDRDGIRVVSYAYDSWGKLISIKDKDGKDVTIDKTHVGYKNPYRYRGYRYDNETGLYYLQSRYYNPEWERFINMDSLGGKIGVLLSHNVFAYCNNNAVNMVDPNGNWAIAISFAAEVIGGAAIMATAFLGYAVYTYYTSSSGSASYSSEMADIGSEEEVSSGTGGGGVSISPEPPKSNKKPKKTTHGHHSYPKYLGGAAAQQTYTKKYILLYINLKEDGLHPKEDIQVELFRVYIRLNRFKTN